MAFHNTAHDSEIEEILSTVDDPTARLAGDEFRSRWSAEQVCREQRPVPYAYLMQRLVAEWTRGRPRLG